jgi:hypothetical protein
MRKTFTENIITSSWIQWRSQTFIFGGGEANAEGARPSRVVRGHAPPGKFWNLESLKCDFKHFGGEILQNSEDYKVHRRHKCSQIFLIFYSELNKLEKSPWKTGGAGQRHLISPLWCWGQTAELGTAAPDIIFLENFCAPELHNIYVAQYIYCTICAIYILRNIYIERQLLDR